MNLRLFLRHIKGGKQGHRAFSFSISNPAACANLFVSAPRLPYVSAESFTYLRYGPFETRVQLADLVDDLSTREDQPFWAVIGQDGRAAGWLSICDVYQNDGAFEIGSIWFAPDLQGTRGSREAIFLLMCVGMDDLKYERLVWRCQAQNEPSFRAALNLGFHHEGTWRNAMVYENWQRDIAWFSIISSEWPVCRAAFVDWLAPENFDTFGHQKTRLQDLRQKAETQLSVE
jgi:RimJ/RimL family protein N-acetyltransferase